ncbi:phosphoribosylformylglycinamidine cyclo-ligase, partial [Rhizobium ruizarguesonis]
MIAVVASDNGATVSAARGAEGENVVTLGRRIACGGGAAGTVDKGTLPR